MRLYKILSVLIFAMLLAGAAQAGEPVFAFEPNGQQVRVPAEFQAWHPQFEKDGDYGESWFFLTHGRDGGVLFAMVTVTNLGMRTFDGRIDMQYYPASGDPIKFHAEHKRDEMKASTSGMDTKIAGARAWFDGAYHFTLDQDGTKINLTLKNKLPSYMLGDGAVKFGANKSDVWTIGLGVPAGVSSGTISSGGKSYSLDGYGYHDHGWSTVKLPDVMSKWFTLRLYHEKYSVVLHQQYLTKKYDSKMNNFGVFGIDGRSVGAMRNFVYNPTSWENHKAGYKIPITFDVAFKVGGYSVKGTVEMDKFLDGIDVLEQVSWPIRVVIKAFYAKPYMYRYIGKYKLDITAPDGTTEQITGTSVVEANYF